MSTELIPHEGLNRLDSGLAAVIGAPNVFAAARALAVCTKGTRISLARFRTQNRFASDGRTIRRILFSLSMFDTVSKAELDAWVADNPVMRNVMPPPGFQLLSSDIQMDDGGQELRATVEMVESDGTVLRRISGVV